MSQHVLCTLHGFNREKRAEMREVKKKKAQKKKERLEVIFNQICALVKILALIVLGN